VNITDEKVRQLVELLDTGKQPVIQFTTGLSESIDYEKGMQCKCVSYRDDSLGVEPDDLVIIVKTNFSDFTEYNKLFESSVWGGKADGEWVKWSESVWYPTDYEVNIFLGNDSGNDFEFVENNELFEAFKDSGESNYVLWLENCIKEMTRPSLFMER
jgi:hypothetical protein